MEFTGWESYFYPETYDEATGQGVLRNKYGSRDFFELRDLEYAATARRERELYEGMVKIEHTYGADHLRAIHGHLFQDVYEWAGHFRTVNMGKGGAIGFANVLHDEPQQMLEAVQEFVQSYDWPKLDRPDVVKNAAVIFAYVNQAHPFREGNGRSSKMFMEHIAEQTAYTFDFSRIDPDLWNEASEQSRPQPGREWIDPTPLIPVFNAAAVDRNRAEGVGRETSRSPRIASYPRPATEVTRPMPPGTSPQARGGPSMPGRGYGMTPGEGRE